ncbi:MAG: hypothetical protein ACTSYB_11855 [Candidatus Helarchaeota archaeon]
MDIKAIDKRIFLILVIICLSGAFPAIFSPNPSIGIIFPILEMVLVWFLLVLGISYLLRFAPTHKDVKLQEFSLFVGFGFIPVLISNIVLSIITILKPAILTNLETINELEMYLSSHPLYSLWFIIPKILPFIAYLAMAIIIGFAIKKIYQINLTWAMYLSIPLVFLTSFSISTLFITFL